MTIVQAALDDVFAFLDGVLKSGSKGRKRGSHGDTEARREEQEEEGVDG
jgi:hypothetical protein